MASTSPKEKDADQSETRAELERLWKAEFGELRELVLRYLLIAAGSITAFLYAGVAFPLIWGAAYFATQWITHKILLRLVLHPGQIPILAGVAAYLLTTLTFISMPLGLVLFGDAALAYCGAMGMLALCAFSLWRSEPPRLLLYYDIAIAWTFAAAAAHTVLPLADDMLARVMIVLLTGAVAVYYALALMTTRRNRGILRDASTRAIEAQKMEAIGRLSGGIAHDFNNILTVLQGNLELYDEITDPAERRKLVSEAFAAARRASGLVRQLLAFARRAPLEPALIEVTGVIEELTSMTARLLPATITVFPAVPTEPTFVSADRDQLLSSLLNLVINARDAMEGNGELTIAASDVTVTRTRKIEGLSPGRYVGFAVNDTGHGMSADTLERALEPFFTTKPVGAGSGLGLPTAKGFAEQSGGQLQIETGPSGTTITIYLPRASPAAP